MPKYEVGYILSSGIADDEIGNVTAEIYKAVENSGGKILNEDHWGRRKLAYPIGRTRNGYYVFLTVDLLAEKVKDIEHKLLTNEHVIRFIIVNMTEGDRLRAKDEAARAAVMRQAELIRKPEAKTASAQTENLDEKIEKAISGKEENV